jgi:hypothetical protein
MVLLVSGADGWRPVPQVRSVRRRRSLRRLQRIDLERFRQSASTWQSLDALIARALPQAAEYADRVGADETHLIVFDRTGRTTWDDRIRHTSETVGARTIGVWGA